MEKKIEATANAGGKVVLSRRAMLASAAGIATVAGLVAPTAHAAKPYGNGHPVFGAGSSRRSSEAMAIRAEAARTWLQDPLGSQTTNGDEGLYADYRGSYSKALPHNALGEVDPSAYRKYLTALGSARNADFEQIPLGGNAKLANPQGAYRFEMVGRDAHSTYMRPAPEFASAETAAEMGELYWKALCRDVPFADFGSNPLISAAVSDLNAFSETVGPKSGGSVTSDTVFRGETPGDLTGPYISQFLFRDIPFGNSNMVQKYASPAPGASFMTSTSAWLAVQNGSVAAQAPKVNTRYINDPRALAEFVHSDFSFQAYQSAALLLLSIPGSFDLGNLYNTSSTQGAFVTLGGPDVLDLVAKAGNLALTGAWYQKWLVHRRLRPEVYAGRLHHQLTGAKHYGLPTEIEDSEGVARVLSANSSYFLPQAFPEGSPTHPAYPAGHATIAGACCTVLKAFFEETKAMPTPVTTDATGSALVGYGGSLTIGGEINKLANNIALGRDWAGVHYRSDGVDGLKVGEQQAIGLLQDYSRTYNEAFAGFTLTKFDGTQILIQNGRVF